MSTCQVANPLTVIFTYVIFPILSNQINILSILLRLVALTLYIFAINLLFNLLINLFIILLV